MRAILFPFAGGNFGSYRELEQSLQKHGCQTVTVDYPGHGRRMAEPLYTKIEPILNSFFQHYRDYLNPPYRIFGHSMGALIAYLATRKICEMGWKRPEKLVLSARPAPSRQIANDSLPHCLEQEAFIDYMAALGGIGSEELREPAFLEYYEPIMRADLEVVHGFPPMVPDPLPVPIFAMMGSQENFEEHSGREWERFTAHDFEFKKFEGNHFFIHQYVDEISKIIIQ